MSFNPTTHIDNAKAFVSISKRCLQRNNPLVNGFRQLQYLVYCIATFRQKLMIVKQRVNHMRYRLHQMEQLINQNNEYSFIKGQSLNQIR